MSPRDQRRSDERARRRLERYLVGWAEAIDGDIARVPLLGSDLTAVIDVDDVDLVSRFKWRYVRGYAQARPSVNGQTTSLLMHRLLLGPQDGFQVDHIDRDRLNNRRSNLRVATQSQNQGNCTRRSNNTSGYKGVNRRPSGKWSAKLGQQWLGTFDSAVEAAAAYDAAAVAHYGEFAVTNEVGA